MKRAVSISTALLFIAIFLNLQVASSFVGFSNKGEKGIAGNYSTFIKASPVQKGEALKVENIDSSLVHIKYDRESKKLNTCHISFAFSEHSAQSLLVQLFFEASSLLVRHGKKAIIFPFHYFW